MANYIIRRLLYAIPILIGVNIITAILFFYINTPDNMARIALGEKNLKPETVEIWKRERGYHNPLFINTKESGLSIVTQTIFFQKSINLMWFDFGKSDRNNRDIKQEIKDRMGASMAITIPTFFLGVFSFIVFSMLLAFFRGTKADLYGVTICVFLMSISALFFIIGGQYLLGKTLKLFPISGYDTGIHAIKFVMLPVIIGVIASIGSSTRFYRTVFLEEINRDYVRTARAKGLGEYAVLFKHVLKNAMIPILTNVVVSLPFLFYGSLLMENFFAIPGLGSFTIDAINSQDFAIVRSMVYLGAVLYIIGLIMTDIAYSIFDPRVRLE